MRTDELRFIFWLDCEVIFGGMEVPSRNDTE